MILCGRHGLEVLAVYEGEHGNLRTGQELLDNDTRTGTAECTAELWIDGKMVRSIYLPQAADEEISLAEYGKEVLLEVKNHRIAFISSDCPDKVCIHNGWLAREGEQAVCLPNRVSVILTDGSTVPVDLG